ncbi:MAG: hypothetical protein C0446_05735 [Chitinophaga sp.]|nr:hypothetical protein [Chitinophaga sp.]
MKPIITLILFFLTPNLFAQKKQIPSESLRWEISVASGLYSDLFYANIIFGGDNAVPLGYSDKPGKAINFGKLDRFEIKYLFDNKRSALSFYFQNAQWKELYGSAVDPLGVWKEIKDDCRRMHFTMNYFRMFPSGKKGIWSIGSGFQVQIEKKSFPFYRVDNPANPTAITEISARPDWTYFEDWAIPLTVAHHWTINKNLKLGIMLNTAYTMGTGVDGLAILGNIAIPFGKIINQKNPKR